MKALIDPESPVIIITGWKKFRGIYNPITETIANSARVCQIESDENVFGVADILFWQDCTDQIIPDRQYLDLVSKQFINVPLDAPYPIEDQPTTEGTQTI
jgi:hypothetical protein